jgi:uncharacterized repeat protein (TIGR04076 family)
MKPSTQSAEDRPTGRRPFCRAASMAALGLAGMESVAEAGQSGGTAPASTTSPKEDAAGRVKAITVKVISVKGECGIHKTGDSCSFTETGVQGRICIHAMYSMLPKAFAMMYGARFPWLQNPDTATHACPDAANPVVFEIARTYAS